MELLEIILVIIVLMLGSFTAGIHFIDWYRKPIPMILYCPNCYTKHIDRITDTWKNPPHRSHLCEHCGCIWRPADVYTNGVKEIKTKGQKDTWL